MVKEICQEKDFSTARACKIINIERSSFYYQSDRDYSQIEERLLCYTENLPARAALSITKGYEGMVICGIINE